MNNNPIIGISTVANTLGITLDMAYEIVAQEDFPACFIDGRWLVHKDDFLRWIKKEAMSLNG